MKPVTKERILHALESISDRHSSAEGIDGKVVELMSMYGLKSFLSKALGEPITQIEFVKQNLELDYIGAPKSPQDLLDCMNRWKAKIHHYRGWKRKIFGIQAAHGISGLDWEEYEIRGIAIRQPWIGEDLPLIPEDLHILKQHKNQIVEKYLEAISGIQFWVSCEPNEGYWKPVSVAELTAALPFYDWASVWAQDFDDWPDEYHIDLGSGIDVSSCNISRTTFCACENKPSI